MDRTAAGPRTQVGGTRTDVRDFEDSSAYTGNNYFVSSVNGIDGAGYGNSFDLPVATLDYAIGLCTSSHGDVIYLLPGHAESPTSPITADITGIRIIGLGDGGDRPDFTINHIGDGITVTAPNVRLENLRFPTPSAATSALINVAAANATVDGCYFDLGANVLDAITITADGEKPTFEGNEVFVTANGPLSWLKFEGIVDGVVIRDNIISGSDGFNVVLNGVFDFNSLALTNVFVFHNQFNGNGAGVLVSGNDGSVVGKSIGPNAYGGSAVDSDNNAGGTFSLIQSLTSVAGTILEVKKTLTSSDILTTGVDVTTPSTGGEFEILDVILQTDSTGLAGGTNFTLETDNAAGAAVFFSSAVSGLGANVTQRLAGGSVTPGPAPVLEYSKKITARSTVADCTGAGTITIYLICRRLADGAFLDPVF